jgi:hypothetical protein
MLERARTLKESKPQRSPIMPTYRTGYMDAGGSEPSHGIKTDTRDRKWWKTDPEFANGKYQMTITWHHNIPDNEWREFWNILLQNGWADEMNEFLYLTGMDDQPSSNFRINVLIKKFKYLHKEFERLAPASGKTTADGYRQDANDLEGPTATSWKVGDASQLRTADEMDELRTRISWQDWNIVEGPLNTLRPGDPGDRFDDFSGLIPKERARLIKDFHNYVVAQINSPNTQIKGLCSTLKGFRDLRGKRVIPFSLEIWEKNSDSKGKIPTVNINGIARQTWRTKQPS